MRLCRSGGYTSYQKLDGEELKRGCRKDKTRPKRERTNCHWGILGYGPWHGDAFGNERANVVISEMNEKQPAE
jgi:hypothetical protein